MSTLWDYWVSLLALAFDGLGQRPLVGAVGAAILILLVVSLPKELKR